jgi:hypothetical protein
MQDCRQTQVHLQHLRHPSQRMDDAKVCQAIFCSLLALLLGKVIVRMCTAPQVALTLGLQRRLDANNANVRCFAADPGEVLTDITRTLPPPLRSMYRALLPWILFTPAQGKLAASSLLKSGHLQQ